MVITVLEKATHTEEALFTYSTFLSEYFSMVNLLMTIYFGHTDATEWCISGNRVRLTDAAKYVDHAYLIC
jgi:hypothetical protein